MAYNRANVHQTTKTLPKVPSSPTSTFIGEVSQPIATNTYSSGPSQSFPNWYQQTQHTRNKIIALATTITKKNHEIKKWST